MNQTTCVYCKQFPNDNGIKNKNNNNMTQYYNTHNKLNKFQCIQEQYTY